MSKARLIRPEIWTDAKFVGLDPLARLMFVGMWNFACDNGHLDDNLLELKMRILPADSCDVGALLDEVLATGMVVRKDAYLKIPRLAEKQPLDLRYLQFCDHCEGDPESHYGRSDKKDGRGAHASGTRAARETPASGRGRGVGVGDGDGDGLGRKTAPASKARQLPTDWEPNDGHRSYAEEQHLDLTVEVAQFADHHRAKGSTMKDWDAAFRTWLRNAVKFGSQRKPQTRPTAKLLHASQIESAPPGMTDEEYDEWEAAQMRRRQA